MLTKFAAVAGVAVVLLAGALPAAAQSQPKLSAETQAKLRQACTGDIRTLCSDAKPGGGRLVQCLTEKRDKVSDGCKSAMSEARAERQSKMKKQ
ncbi:cysteine rich repeat-containing protein [Chelatococcus reniformis]|uniref:Cysteine rich repeat protein n=1 Tax=Chelatococcus reniformis TaxID=1494448 RepID=A0A916U990_9HYPH|nr:cysteine rich repeat-containing protein [Chelatococcus reniformis]GGC64149.1 hypothetical protein GCM10010994_23500 [Chelatococcus reniformis]